ncbi:MAG: DUF3369 domain-containing protein [Desulfobacteraceae bacterium]|nr:MAG: DUF3369 domain-containing protein [Desulfobacteraceae bacterium]
MAEHHPGQADSEHLVFADESVREDSDSTPAHQNLPWNILIVDDEEEVHEITRIALRGFVFDQRPIHLISAYSEKEAREILYGRDDIALILLDVVMERDNSGLELVEFIRHELKNLQVRIVLRTGQPGKAPEHEVIVNYDINDYKTKPELTAQKLYTSVIACLRAYKNLVTIEKSKIGLELIIDSTASIFQNQSMRAFAGSALTRLIEILSLEKTNGIHSAYAVALPGAPAVILSGTGKYKALTDQFLDDALPLDVISFYHSHKTTGREQVLGDAYVGVFKTKEGFSSLLYLAGLQELRPMDMQLVRMFANTVSIGFDNLSLSREIVNTQKEVILTLGEVVETRSKETAHHVTRVAEFCYLLARKYGLDQETSEILRLASPMHDVGKIGIPEAILNKPGKLTSQEFEVIKEHARIGYEILRKSKRYIMESAAIIALQHHERWDGKGYPQGLARQDIHIYGRIAAIADVFDALSHTRAYKDAWPMDQVIDFFESAAASQFDPELTQIFLSNADEFIEINARFPE